MNTVTGCPPKPGIARRTKTPTPPPDAIERCVRTVDLALRRRAARDEAVAAIDRLFGAEPLPAPSLSSSVHDIGLRLRTASVLDDLGIRTAAALRIALRTGRLWTFPQFGPSTVYECESAIRLIEGQVHDYQI
jgi:hypothetical protein